MLLAVLAVLVAVATYAIKMREEIKARKVAEAVATANGPRTGAGARQHVGQKSRWSIRAWNCACSTANSPTITA